MENINFVTIGLLAISLGINIFQDLMIQRWKNVAKGWRENMEIWRRSSSNWRSSVDELKNLHEQVEMMRTSQIASLKEANRILIKQLQEKP
jgi:hypothetical protein